MSDGRAIAAISATLAQLLQPAGGDAVQLTLYRVTPSARARNPRGAAATAVDLHYLVACAGDADLVLGKAITSLAATPVLTGALIDQHVTDPALQGAVGPGETLQISLETPTFEQTCTLWIALGQPLRPALFYAVGPVLLT